MQTVRVQRAQGESEIDGLLARVACLRQMWEGTERLSKNPRPRVGRPRQGLLRPAAVR